MQLRSRTSQRRREAISSRVSLAVLLVFGPLSALTGCNGGNKSSSTTPPTISSLSPTSGAVGAAVTIAGSGFGASQGSSTVTFNGTAAATASAWSATSITVAVPSGATTGNVVVTVGGQASNGVGFTVATTACTSGGSESLLSGGYAFMLKGFDGAGDPALVIGALTFDGAGTITAGSVDMNLNSGVESNLAVTSGTYGVGKDQRGCMVITTAKGTQNYRFSVGNITGGVASTGHVIDFDKAGPFTAGTLRKQSGGPFSNASASGSYVFGGSSWQNPADCASPCKFGIIGVIGFDGKGGVSGGSVDINQNGVVDGNAANTTWPASPTSIDAGGTYSVSANGRATLTFTFGGGAGGGHTILYLVSPGEAFFMDADPQTTNSISAGTTLLQSGAPFAANPLSGTYVGYDSGTDATGVGRTDVYLLGPLTSGNNALAGTQLRDAGGTFTSSSLAGDTYSVSTEGRSIISNGGHAPLLYLVSASQAFFLQSNPSVDSGFFESQSGGPFSTSSATGSYAFGYIDPDIPSGGATSGIATLTPASNSEDLTLDQNSSGGSAAGQTQSLTYSIDNTGIGLIPLGCSFTATSTTCQTAILIVSPTKAVAMDFDNVNPEILTADK